MVQDCDLNSSPGALQLEWLKSEFEDIRLSSKKAIIIGHIPPIDSFYKSSCFVLYTEIIQKYNHLIICQLFGHIHIDDFFILKHNEVPVGVALTSPAFVPAFNPSFRVYEVDDHKILFLTITSIMHH